MDETCWSEQEPLSLKKTLMEKQEEHNNEKKERNIIKKKKKKKKTHIEFAMGTQPLYHIFMLHFGTILNKKKESISFQMLFEGKNMCVSYKTHECVKSEA
ncbi:hypothetical protein POVWA2_025980 [Plasmodium ovale wallikeri]|uniref:Uncharacterized protein n=1 Tax=Plasmodium ovale wallikeri TaxID=864142 RepID=A0A1A8YVI4_PLAOA|nr:hypothetical protein POVWA2_025980 [Plasmodium ovale wallikeri]